MVKSPESKGCAGCAWCATRTLRQAHARAYFDSPCSPTPPAPLRSIGRTGRAGKKGLATAFFSEKDTGRCWLFGSPLCGRCLPHGPSMPAVAADPPACRRIRHAHPSD